MNRRDYQIHRKALVEHAMLISVEGLQAYIQDEMTRESDEDGLPYLVFDSMLIALEKKMGKKAFLEWQAKL